MIPCAWGGVARLGHRIGGPVVGAELACRLVDHRIDARGARHARAREHPPAAVAGSSHSLLTKAGGHGVIERCFFGPPTGYDDVVDFTGGNRPGEIVHFIDNVFTGGDDDLLDLDGTDAWVEGNPFMYAHKNRGTPDSSSAVSGGNHGADTSEITIIGNLMYDCDQAIDAKQGNFYTLINNTVVHQNHAGSVDTDGAVVILADEGATEGAGAYLEGNILFDIEKLARNVTRAQVTFVDNLMPLPWPGPGMGNSPADPRRTHVPQLAEAAFSSWADAQVLRDWFALQPDSPARGTGPNGRDRGAWCRSAPRSRASRRRRRRRPRRRSPWARTGALSHRRRLARPATMSARRLPLRG